MTKGCCISGQSLARYRTVLAFEGSDEAATKEAAAPTLFEPENASLLVVATPTPTPFHFRPPEAPAQPPDAGSRLFSSWFVSEG